MESYEANLTLDAIKERLLRYGVIKLVPKPDLNVLSSRQKRKPYLPTLNKEEKNLVRKKEETEKEIEVRFDYNVWRRFAMYQDALFL